MEVVCLELTDLDYEELSRYRDGPCEAPEIRPPRLQRLMDQGYLEPSVYMTLPNGSYAATHYALTLIGEDALAKYERQQDEMRKQSAENAANRSAQIKAAAAGALLGSLLTYLLTRLG